MNKGDKYNIAEYIITYKNKWGKECIKKIKGSERQLNNEIYKIEHIYKGWILEVEIKNNKKQLELFA